MLPQFFALLESTHSGAPLETVLSAVFRERERGRQLSPQHIKRFVFPLNQQSGLLEGRARSEKILTW